MGVGGIEHEEILARDHEKDIAEMIEVDQRVVAKLWREVVATQNLQMQKNGYSFSFYIETFDSDRSDSMERGSEMDLKIQIQKCKNFPNRKKKERYSCDIKSASMQRDSENEY